MISEGSCDVTQKTE